MITSQIIKCLWEWWLREPEVEGWETRLRVGFDATDGRNGGAKRSAGEMDQ